MMLFKLTRSQLVMYVRDRQSVFFALFFPLMLMLALGFAADRGVDPIPIGFVGAGDATHQRVLVDVIEKHELLEAARMGEAQARRALEEGERDLVVLLPAQSAESGPDATVPLTVLMSAAAPQRAQQALTVLNGVLRQAEREIRGTAPLFDLVVEDVRGRETRYVDFLIPGLLAFVVLQLSIAGSGFNIVEYKRKGILTRLFVTPLRASEFVTSLILTRLVVIVAQVSILLVIAKLVFDVTVLGNLALLYGFVIAGSVLFLSLGFALGSVAKTQGAIMALGNLVIFPQIFLAGVFFPLEALPAWLRPVASILPLNFLSDALRRVASEGAGLAELGADMLGLGLWIVLGVTLAVRLFSWGEPAAAPGGA